MYREDDAGRPRRAKPKQLNTAPTVFRGSEHGSAIAPGGDGDGEPPIVPPPGGVGFTAERSSVRPLAEVLGDPRVDPRVVRDASLIAARLALRRRRVRGGERGRAGFSTAPFDGNADDVDLDASLELLAERRPFLAEELTVGRPTRARRSVALLADVSGSMNGDKAVLCAAAIGALAAELADDELTVIAFWSDLAVLQTRRSRLNPATVLHDLLRIEPRGLTNVHAAIEQATRELAQSPLERRCIVLLSDCVHNAGPDPRDAARRAPTTHVLLERTGEHDAWLGERIARAGGGRIRTVDRVDQVAPALDLLLGG